MDSKNFKERLLSLQTNMLNFAYALTSNRDDAYDLVQDTSLKVLANEDKFQDNTNFRGWVLTIMRNLFINNYRASVRASVVIDRSDDLYQINMSQDSGLDSPEGALSVQEIGEALRKLDPDFGTPFRMYLQGYKYKEIAEEMNLPLGTIKSRIFVARKSLQRNLSDYRYD